MFQSQANSIRGRLRSTASALVVAAAAAIGANAADVTLTSANSPWNMTGDTTVSNVVVASGTTAYLTADYNSIPTGDLGIVWSNSPSTSSTGSCAFGGCYATADTITVNSGGKIVIDNPWGWQPFQSIFNVSGTAEFLPASWGGGQTILMGSNTFLGDIVMDAGFWGSTNTLQVGQNWQSASIVFGSATNIKLANNTLLEMWLGSSSATMGGALSGTGALTLHSGSLTINGANTAANAYTGTITLDAGTTLTIGDASHSTAVFGDPTASALSLVINSTSSAIGVLKGYGTIDAAVTNNGIVRPGGTSGTPGTLTINGAYTQSSSGQLIIEVSPTAASSLKVKGAASLNGSLVVNIDSGTYGNAVYSIFSATSITGGFSTVSTVGNTSGAIVGLQKTSTSYNLVTEKASAAQTFGHLAAANRNGLFQFSRSLYDVMAVGAPSGAATVASGKVDVWMTPVGSIDNVGRNGAGYEEKAVGVSMGADHHFAWHNALLGGAFSYRNGQMDVKGETTTASTDAYNLAVYGGADVQNARVDGMFFYNFNDSSSKRVMTGYGTAGAAETGWAWGMSVQVSRSLFNDLVTPYLRGTFARIHQDGATEAGTGTFDLAYTAINQNTFAGDAGVRVHLLHPTGERKIKLDLDLAVRHDFSDPGETVMGSFATLTGSSFTYDWKGDSQNALLLGVNVSDEIMDKLEVFGRVNGTFSLYRRAGEIAVGAKYHL